MESTSVDVFVYTSVVFYRENAMILAKLSRLFIPIVCTVFILIAPVFFVISCTSGVDIGGTTIYELTILNDGDGSTSPAGKIEANHGVAINITATPDSIFGYNNQFEGWTVISF